MERPPEDDLFSLGFSKDLVNWMPNSPKLLE